MNSVSHLVNTMELSPESLVAILEMGNDIVAELRALDLGRSVHLTREVVGHALRSNSAIQTFDDQVRNFGPAQVAEHHFAAQHNAARVYAVLVGVFGGGAMGGLEDGMAADVIDVAT